MSYVDTAKSQVLGVASRVAAMLPHRATAQTVTIGLSDRADRAVLA